jgi:hypothetical protein
LAGVTGFEAELRGEHGWPPERQAHRYVRTYGTRAREILTECAASGIWAGALAPTSKSVR